jgi:hypothetical protein
MMPDAFYQDLPTLSDTEVRIILVAYANPQGMSMQEMQTRTGRHRQVYDAIKTLEKRGLLRREKLLSIDTPIGTWQWITSYTTVLAVPIVEKETPVKRTRKATPAKPPKEPKPVVEKPSTPQKHAAVLAYTAIVNRRPSNLIAEQIIAEVTDIERWQAAVKDYVMQGWNPLNVAGMLRLYRGEMQVNKTNGRRSLAITIPHSAPSVTKRQWESYLEDNE